MSPALNRSFVLLHFEPGNVGEICNGIIFNFYLGLPHMSVLKSLYPLADKKTQWQILCFILAVIAALFGMSLGIALGVVVSNGSKSGLLVTYPPFYVCHKILARKYVCC